MSWQKFYAYTLDDPIFIGFEVQGIANYNRVWYTSLLFKLINKTKTGIKNLEYISVTIVVKLSI